MSKRRRSAARVGPMYITAHREQITVQHQGAEILGRLRIVRNYLTQADPWLCTGCPDVEHRLKLRRIVQRGETDGHNSWSSLATREQRRATIGAKAASREPAAASTNRVRLRRAGDRHVRYPHDEAGSERSATRALAVQAVAVERRNWRARACIADRSACTPAGKWSSHGAVSSYTRSTGSPRARLAASGNDAASHSFDSSQAIVINSA